MQVTTLEATPNPEDVIVQAARNDYETEYVGDMDIDELIDRSGSDTKEEFIHRILERGHFGVTEHPYLTLSFEGVSRVCMAQATRHRHQSFDVQSLRYVDLTDDSKDFDELFYIPSEITHNERIEAGYRQQLKSSLREYRGLIEFGIPKDEARYVLPLATRVNMVMSGNLRSMLHFLDLRLSADVQNETIEYAELVAQELEEWCPIVTDYYMENMNPRENRLAP